MVQLTEEVYEAQKASCEGLCDIESKDSDRAQSVMPCVTCPFCKEIVTAQLTETTIHCPACKITVKR